MRAADRVYSDLRAGILSGRFRAGAHLGEVEVAQALDASRTPVREAIRRLESEGLVEVLPHRGARVASWSRQDVEEIFDVRHVLESHAAGLAAGRLTDQSLDDLDVLCDEMERVGVVGPGRDVDRLTELNRALHNAVLDAAGNDRLAALLRSVIAVPVMRHTFDHYDRDALARSHAHHRELVAALRAGDGSWAEAVMRSHVRAARVVMLSPSALADLEGGHGDASPGTRDASA